MIFIIKSLSETKALVSDTRREAPQVSSQNRNVAAVTADKRSQLDGFMALMFTLIRRLKLKDRRTKSYNMNKKKSCTNCERNTVNKKRR